MSDLLPCPFCGGEAQTLRKDGSWWCVACRTPFCCVIGEFDTEDEAVAAWNTRAAVEYADWFYLPKPKYDVAHVVYSGIEKTDNGYKVNAFADIVEENVRKWGKELDEHLIKRMCEVWNPERTCYDKNKSAREHGATLFMWRCSNCDESLDTEMYRLNYCPNCGARVLGADE